MTARRQTSLQRAVIDGQLRDTLSGDFATVRCSRWCTSIAARRVIAYHHGRYCCELSCRCAARHACTNACCTASPGQIAPPVHPQRDHEHRR
jgi:hypothetical protein